LLDEVETTVATLSAPRLQSEDEIEPEGETELVGEEGAEVSAEESSSSEE
jgi:hypothetical protein